MSQTMYCLKQKSFIFKTYYSSQPVLNAALNLCSLDKTAFFLTFFSDMFIWILPPGQQYLHLLSLHVPSPVPGKLSAAAKSFRLMSSTFIAH